MKSDLKKAWVLALESGNYKQTRGALRNPDGYCCLGVLCDIIDPEGWDSASFWKYKGESRSGFLPEKLMADINLSQDEVEKLAFMNDDGKTFKKIAKHIKENI